MTFKEYKGDCGFGCGSTDLEKNTCGCYNEWLQQQREILIEAMGEAFKAGANWSSCYYTQSLGFYPDFKLWVIQNKDVIDKILG
jgi:hypothetical protein